MVLVQTELNKREVAEGEEEFNTNLFFTQTDRYISINSDLY